MKYLQAFVLSVIVFFLFFFSFANAQTTSTYKGKVYPIQMGSRGGQFIVLEDKTKHYIAQDPPIVNGNIATYNGKQYPIQTGPKGGRYFVVDGSKHYIPKKK